MRCELHFDKTVHFAWNVVDVSIIIIVRYVRTRIILYTSLEPNTMLLSSKNFVRTKNAFKGMDMRLSSRL